MKTRRSAKAYKDASKYIPGGVNSPVRAFRNIGCPPPFIESAAGARVTDIDGNSYTDFCLSWGVHILGHGHPSVLKAVRAALKKGTSYGAPCTAETELARRIAAAVPSVEKVRFVSSGTEAVMSALRLARGFTKRDVIVKFDGCYHGHADHLLVAGGSGLSELKESSSAGIPASFLENTVSVPFNDEAAVREVFGRYKGKIAALIVEPVPANMGVVLPKEGFLDLLRRLTEENGSLLIFDEVITGFRLGLAGAQGYFGIRPDLSCFGKIIGGGFPVGAFGGRREIMDLLAPLGPVYQAGTLSGNPVAMAAGIAVLDKLSKVGFYSRLWKGAEGFTRELSGIAKKKGLTVNAVGPMFSLFFSGTPVTGYASLKGCDPKRFSRFYRSLLSDGIYLSPAQGEADFLSVQHTPLLLEKTLRLVDRHLSL